MKYSGRMGIEPLPSVRGNSSLAPATLMDDVPLSADGSALRDSGPRSHEPLKPRVPRTGARRRIASLLGGPA
eukprot:9212429-Heterocapsa_arctica.AAC.1